MELLLEIWGGSIREPVTFQMSLNVHPSAMKRDVAPKPGFTKHAGKLDRLFRQYLDPCIRPHSNICTPPPVVGCGMSFIHESLMGSTCPLNWRPGGQGFTPG